MKNTPDPTPVDCSQSASQFDKSRRHAYCYLNVTKSQHPRAGRHRLWGQRPTEPVTWELASWTVRPQRRPRGGGHGG
jgi:hypothetical protein